MLLHEPHVTLHSSGAPISADVPDITMQIRHVATVAFLHRDSRTILLQARTRISKFGEHWGFFGGSMQDGESPEAAVRREIQEELTWTLGTLRHFRSYSAELPNGVSAVEEVFVSAFPGFPALCQREGDGMALFTPEQAGQLRVLPVYQTILVDLDTNFDALCSEVTDGDSPAARAADIASC